MNDYRFRWQPEENQWYFIQVTYGPLHNRSVAHPFLLAAFTPNSLENSSHPVPWTAFDEPVMIFICRCY